MRDRVTAEAYRDYIKRLLALGYTKLGSASMASVFLHPSNPKLAVKVFQTKDAAYRQWLEAIGPYPANPYLPKIESIHYPEGSPQVGIVFMERLRPMPKTNAEWLRVNQVVHDNLPAGHVLRRVGPIGIPMPLIHSLSKDWPSIVASAKQAVKSGDLTKDFVQALVLIGRAAQGRDNFVDITPSNVMLRGSQLVFTDPVNTGV
jgi:hypothetical protein